MQNVTNKKDLLDTVDAKLAAKLTLYKNVMANFEFKVESFYLQVTPQQTTISPLKFAPYDDYVYSTAPLQVAPYYTPIGTQRTVKFNAQNLRLRGYNLPQGMYKYKINLDSVIITQSPDNWLKLRNEVPVQNGGLYDIARTYDIQNVYDNQPAYANRGSEQDVSYIYYSEALKRTVGQPLFIRLDNIADDDEYYHFVSQPSGDGTTTLQTSQSIIRDNLDINEFKVSFGHMIFVGSDKEYNNNTFDPNGLTNNSFVPAPSYPDPTVRNQIQSYQNFKYLDYNQEHYNSVSPMDLQIENIGNLYVFPCGRGTSLSLDKVLLGENTSPEPRIRLRTDPLFFNQQASSLTMRFR